MWLHIGVVRPEKFLGAFYRQSFNLVSEILPAIIPPARIAFAVFVGENAPHSRQHITADVVFARDKFQAFTFTLRLICNQTCYYCVYHSSLPLVSHTLTPFAIYVQVYYYSPLYVVVFFSA